MFDRLIAAAQAKPWHAVYQCWYSPRIYREAAHTWRGLGYQYLVLLLVTLWALAAIHVQFLVNDFVEGYLRPLVNDFPQGEIKKGVVIIDKPGGVYQVKDRRNGRLVFDFDLRDGAPFPEKSKDGFFFRRNGYLIQYQGRQASYIYGANTDFKLDKVPAYRAMQLAEAWSGLAVLGTLWLASFLFCALQVLVYALLGKLLAILNRRRLNYTQLVRLSVVAITPALIIDTIQRLLCAGIPAWTLTSIGLTIGYLIFGIRANTIGYALALRGSETKPEVKAEK